MANGFQFQHQLRGLDCAARDAEAAQGRMDGQLAMSIVNVQMKQHSS